MGNIQTALASSFYTTVVLFSSEYGERCSFFLPYDKLAFRTLTCRLDSPGDRTHFDEPLAIGY